MTAPGDRHELEADRIASHVLEGRGSTLFVQVGTSNVGAAREAAPEDVHDAISSPGEPLAAESRHTMEARFGHDFASVRVHADASAARSAKSVGAMAYTVGGDIVFNEGRYRPGSAQGDRLIAHELVHVLQQRSASVMLQRAPDDTAASDAELELGRRLREPDFAAGYALAFYDQDEPEAERRAQDFASRERAIGLKGTKITADNLVISKAISGAKKIDTTVPPIATVVNAALARVPADKGASADAAAAPGKVRALAIFAHGTPEWCSLSITTSNAPGIFKTIAPNLAQNVRVVLYTCSSGRAPDEEDEWVKGTMRPGGKGSLASTVRDTLAAEKVEGGSVWGHATVGHTSRNFALREFAVGAGKGAEGESYVTKYVFTDADRTKAIESLAVEITTSGYTVAEDDPKFIAAATAELELAFYAAYAGANKNLKGENVAEEAPMYPYMTAARVEKYWNDTYWPANKAKVAAKVIRRMKLKKT